MTRKELTDLRTSLPPTSTQKCLINLVNNLTGQNDTFNVSLYRVRCKLAAMEGWSDDKLENIMVKVTI